MSAIFLQGLHFSFENRYSMFLQAVVAESVLEIKKLLQTQERRYNQTLSPIKKLKKTYLDYFRRLCQ
jgi:hypothetical protein